MKEGPEARRYPIALRSKVRTYVPRKGGEGLNVRNLYMCWNLGFGIWDLGFGIWDLDTGYLAKNTKG